MWPLNLLSSTKNRQKLDDVRPPQRAKRPCRAHIPPSLEPLEERWLLNGTFIFVTTSPNDPTTPVLGHTTLPDAITQTSANPGAMSLAVARNVPANPGTMAFISSGTNDNILPFSKAVPATLRPTNDFLSQVSPPAPSLPPPSSIFQAASTLFFDGYELGVGKANQLFGIPEIYAYPVPVAALNASIDFYSPYVGPWAPLFVLAGGIVGAEVQYQEQINSFQSF